MGSHLGVLKAAATKLGVPFDEYRRRVETGEKWCTGCREWHPVAEFYRDRSRRSGLASFCILYAAEKHRTEYVPRPRKKRGFLVAFRTGDKKQARRRVNYLVEQGRIPKPNDLPCVDCDHVWAAGERRHEYDHAKGYDDPEAQLYVDPVCAKCHRARERRRGVQIGRRANG